MNGLSTEPGALGIKSIDFSLYSVCFGVHWATRQPNNSIPPLERTSLGNNYVWKTFRLKCNQNPLRLLLEYA